jgi:NAD(P)-dependent dehydrogenase (short-subunit alcohol dehydrogenase family)
LQAPDLTGRPLSELVSLAGRVAVVTGGARGIGLATGRRLAEAGATVVLADVDGEAAEAAARDLGGRVLGRTVDAASSDSVSRLAGGVLEEHGSLDVWVSNAGVYPSHRALEMTDAEWDRVLDLDLRGVFVCAREAGRRMVEAGRGGVIVNIASTASYRVAGLGVSHYVAAKHGVLGLTKSLAVELGRHGIRVLAVAPAVTATPGIEEARPALEAAGFTLDGLGAELPLGRIAVPDDVARAVLFCASDLSALMTGSALLVDAGYLAT